MIEGRRAGAPIAARWWWPPAAGLAFALAYPPLNLLPLAILAPWPLLAFLEGNDGASPRRAFLGGYLFGLAHFGALLTWIAGLTGFSVMAVPAYIATVLVMAFNGGLTALAVGFARGRRVPVVLSLPLAWTAIEWLRSFGDLGFTWGLAADTLAAYPLLIQPAELGGAYLLSLWLLSVSAVLWGLLRARRPAIAALAIVLAAAVPLYGFVRLEHLERASAEWPRLDAAAIQPNIPQDRKWDEAFVDETLRRLVVLTRRAAADDPELVVWPESAVPVYLRYDPRARELVPALSAEIDAPILTGTNDADTLPGESGAEPADYRVYNAAFLVRPEGFAPGRYAKRRLVPVAERVPFVPSVATSLFERLSSWTGQFAPGEPWTTWSVGEFGFGVTICYESVFPNVSRRLVREGADFLVNITNDAWFGPTAAPYQHASHLSLRAVENRVSYLRSANTGISGWVDPLGRWRVRTPLYDFAVITAELPIPAIDTLYTRWGNWAPMLTLLALAGLCVRSKEATRSGSAKATGSRRRRPARSLPG